MDTGNISNPTSFRKWFSTADEEIILWIEKDQKLRTFQLCLKKPTHEIIVSWNEDKGLSTNSLDDGGDNPTSNRSPVIREDSVIVKLEECENAMASILEVHPEFKPFYMQVLSILTKDLS